MKQGLNFFKCNQHGCRHFSSNRLRPISDFKFPNFIFYTTHADLQAKAFATL